MLVIGSRVINRSNEQSENFMSHFITINPLIRPNFGIQFLVWMRYSSEGHSVSSLAIGRPDGVGSLPGWMLFFSSFSLSSVFLRSVFSVLLLLQIQPIYLEFYSYWMISPCCCECISDVYFLKSNVADQEWISELIKTNHFHLIEFLCLKLMNPAKKSAVGFT